MKAKLLIAASFVALATMGFDCINDPLIVSVSLDPFSHCYQINPGPNVNYGGQTIIDPNTLMDDSYRDKVEDARVYDITVQSTGSFSGTVSNGIVTINGVPILTYSGSWSDFSTPQSLVRRSSHIQKNNAGIQELLRSLRQRPLLPDTLGASGTLSGGGVPPVPAGLGVCVNIYAQIDANIKH